MRERVPCVDFGQSLSATFAEWTLASMVFAVDTVLAAPAAADEIYAIAVGGGSAASTWRSMHSVQNAGAFVQFLVAALH